MEWSKIALIMLKILPFLLLFSLICTANACNEEAEDLTPEDASGDLPTCIGQLVASDNSILAVRVQPVEEQLHYWLNTGAMAYDGVEYVVSDHCDTLCTIGGLRLVGTGPECATKYTGEWRDVYTRE